MIDKSDFLKQNGASALTPTLMRHFKIVPNTVDPTAFDKRTWNWKVFVDYVKPSSKIEVMKVLPATK